MDFEFKQFALNHHHSTLKIGTDAVLLGAWTKIESAKTILDIGCGCGIIAFMLTQKSKECNVLGIDIHQPSIEEAIANAKLSKFVNQLKFKCISLQDFSKNTKEKFDLIVSNPPFFVNALRSPNSNRNLSKHVQNLPFEVLIKNVCHLLSQNGRFSLILPFSEANYFEKICNENNLFCNFSCQIHAKPNKNPNRILMSFSTINNTKITENIIIRDNDNNYTEAYKKLTCHYYINF